MNSVGEERQRERERGRAGFFSAIDYSCFCCFCSKEFLFRPVLGKCCIILLWHCLGLPYGYFVIVF